MLDVFVFYGECEEIGEIKFVIFGGMFDYMIEWSGLDDGLIIIIEISFILVDLVFGDYIVKLMDVNGCIDEFIVIVMIMEGVGIRLVGIDGDCMVKGYIYVDVMEGIGLFMIKWIGDVEGLDIFDGNEYFIEDLFGGIYIVEVLNSEGCF